MSPTLLAGLLWLAPSYALHVGIHEGAHALAANLAGCSATVDLLPTVRDGALTFGTTWSTCAPTPFSILAPVIAEVAWSGLVSVALLFTPSGWLRGILLAELASSATDIGTWVLGTGSAHPTDGARYRKLGGDAALPALGLSFAVGAFGFSLMRTF